MRAAMKAGSQKTIRAKEEENTTDLVWTKREIVKGFGLNNGLN